MKKILLFFYFVFFVANVHSQVSKLVNVISAGNLSSLLTTTEKNTVTDLTVTGNIDARDFKCMRDEITNLSYLDLSTSTINAYSGTGGTLDPLTVVSYSANEMPQNSFSMYPSNAGKTTLKTVFLPNTLLSIGVRTFNNCNAITGIIIPNSVTSIGSNAFYNCAGISNIIIGNAVTTIGNSAFSNCTNINSLNIPNSVISIGTQSFNYCVGLTELKIGFGITSIGDYAFYNCSAIQKITITSPAPPAIYSGTFSGINKATCSLLVNSGLVQTFQNTLIWNAFTKISEIVDANSFSIALQIGSNGSVSSNNVTLSNGSVLMLNLNDTRSFTINPASGYEIATVFYNNIDVKNQLVNNTFTSQPITVNGTLSVTFKKIVIRLTIKSSENGSIVQLCDYGSSPLYGFIPSVGWRVNSVLFNGNDVTSLLVDGVYTLPLLISNAELIITFSSTLTGAPTIINDKIKVSTKQNEILIENTEVGEIIELFDMNGAKLTEFKSTNEKVIIPVEKDKIYILKTKYKTFKLIL